MTTPIIATNTNSPAIAGTKYRSAMDAGVGVDVGVAAWGVSNSMDVSAVELKYELDPPNVAVTVYVPGTSGMKAYEYFPFMLLVVVPIVNVLPFGSRYDNVTGTPVALVGFGDCS